MTDVPHGADWWRANDGKWYPSELRAERRPPAATLGAPPISPAARARQAMASDAPGGAEPAHEPSRAASARRMAESTPEPELEPAVLLELRGSALTSDIDRIGDRLEITSLAVTQRGRGNKERGLLRMEEIIAVEAERTHKGYWLRIQAEDGRELLQQGLEPAPAEQARDLILEHAPRAAQAAREAQEADVRAAQEREAQEAEARAARAAREALEAGARASQARAAEPATDEATATGAGPSGAAADAGALDVPDQIRKLAELHAAGILTDEEFQTKKQQLLDRM